MKTLIGKAAMIATLAASTLSFAVPAEARDHYRHHRGGGDDAAIAIGAGLIGLAIGAAIASDHNDRYDDRGYYYDSYPRYRGGYYYDSYPRYHTYRYDAYRGDWRRDRYRDRHERRWRDRDGRRWGY